MGRQRGIDVVTKKIQTFLKREAENEVESVGRVKMENVDAFSDLAGNQR